MGALAVWLLLVALLDNETILALGCADCGGADWGGCVNKMVGICVGIGVGVIVVGEMVVGKFVVGFCVVGVFVVGAWLGLLLLDMAVGGGEIK
jgi:hypothetical protein